MGSACSRIDDVSQGKEGRRRCQGTPQERHLQACATSPSATPQLSDGCAPSTRSFIGLVCDDTGDPEHHHHGGRVVEDYDAGTGVAAAQTAEQHVVVKNPLVCRAELPPVEVLSHEHENAHANATNEHSPPRGESQTCGEKDCPLYSPASPSLFLACDSEKSSNTLQLGTLHAPSLTGFSLQSASTTSSTTLDTMITHCRNNKGVSSLQLPQGQGNAAVNHELDSTTAQQRKTKKNLPVYLRLPPPRSANANHSILTTECGAEDFHGSPLILCSAFPPNATTVRHQPHTSLKNFDSWSPRHGVEDQTEEEAHEFSQSLQIPQLPRFMSGSTDVVDASSSLAKMVLHTPAHQHHHAHPPLVNTISMYASLEGQEQQAGVRGGYYHCHQNITIEETSPLSNRSMAFTFTASRSMTPAPTSSNTTPSCGRRKLMTMLGSVGVGGTTIEQQRQRRFGATSSTTSSAISPLVALNQDFPPPRHH